MANCSRPWEARAVGSAAADLEVLPIPWCCPRQEGPVDSGLGLGLPGVFSGGTVSVLVRS